MKILDTHFLFLGILISKLLSNGVQASFPQNWKYILGKIKDGSCDVIVHLTHSFSFTKNLCLIELAQGCANIFDLK